MFTKRVNLRIVMKAPEKLYLRKRNKLPLEVVRDEWYETDPQSPYGSVGYIRTDAFIEKAEKYLENQFINDVSVLAGDVVHINFSIAIKNFINYIKGE